jgi:hypothetical protein
MTKAMLLGGCLSVCFPGSCFGQTQEALCPKHIETPTYPPIARTAHVSGKVILTLTLDADGKVSEVKVKNEDDKWVGVLKLGATENIHLWTFAKPPTLPHTQTIVYDYELDASLPGDDGDHPITKVTYDLPDRVTILTNLRFIDLGPGDGSPIKKKHWWQ